MFNLFKKPDYEDINNNAVQSKKDDKQPEPKQMTGFGNQVGNVSGSYSTPSNSTSTNGNSFTNFFSDVGNAYSQRRAQRDTLLNKNNGKS